jgi:hypothetical protein
MQIEVQQPAGSAGLITVFDGLINPDKCSELVNRLKTVWDRSHAGKTLGGVDWRTKTTEDMNFSEVAFRDLNIQWGIEWRDLEDHFSSNLLSAVAIYKQQYRHLDNWISVADTGFQVQRYYKNYGYYRPHVDSFPGSRVHNRVLASVMYLNDVEYGGETNFPLHNVHVKPKAGRIVLFPAVWTHLHESCVPITNDKWIISSFIVNTDMEPPQGDPSTPIQDHDHPHDHLGDDDVQ